MPWEYEPENPKRRHAWDRDEAGFEKVQGRPIGKCPSGLSLELVGALLNSGIPFRNARSRSAWPDRIYALHEGVLYRATPTNPGRSYHGFPELPSEFNNLPSEVKEAIWNLADQSGQRERLERWLDQWRHL